MKKIDELLQDLNIEKASWGVPALPFNLKGKNRVNLVALGDVGTTVLLGLKLLGSDVITEIGIYDLSLNNMKRLEMEMNQILYPFGENPLPPVHIIDEDQLFNCDVFIFCASKGVPGIGEEGGDVRMAQLEANRAIIGYYGKKAKEAEYKGFVAVVSDPVDPLCRAFMMSSGLKPWQIQGYGLGVMNARATYYADRNEKYQSYLTEGRAFGPHGEDLVIANSLENYDDELSKELTALTVSANLQVRGEGYKPYIAPALSSAALSILLTLRGQWHYGSLYLGNEEDGAFLGIKNRMTYNGPVYENLPMDDALYERIKNSFDRLRAIK